MGTHPIFESDFDCLTDFIKMGDLATEIEQMQQDINAFDDELDALEQNGGVENDDSATKKADRKKFSSGRDEEDGEVDEDDEDKDDNKNRKKMKSSIVDTTNRRKSSISKDEINEAQIGGAAGKKRASRLFGNLLATLRTFDEKVKTESVAEKRAEIDKKVDERIATDRRKILEEKRALMQKKNEKEKLLGLLQEKQGFGDLCQTWEDDATKRIGYIWTETEPRVYWKPKTAFPKFLNMAEKTENEILDNLKKSKKEWKEYEVELNNQIEEIKEKNDFKDSDLNVREVNGRAKLLDKDDARNLIKKPAKEIDINKRLVITKTVMNDTRRVKPRNESEEKEDQEPEKKSKKERRKEIEQKRKRRHQSSSDSESEEYVERPKPALVKDVRRVAAKDSGSDHEKKSKQEPTIDQPRRRITVKQTKSDLESSRSEKEKLPKRRRVAKRSDSESEKKTIKTKKPDHSSSSSSESSDDNKKRAPRRSSRRK